MPPTTWSSARTSSSPASKSRLAMDRLLALSADVRDVRSAAWADRRLPNRSQAARPATWMTRLGARIVDGLVDEHLTVADLDVETTLGVGADPGLEHDRGA